MFLTAPKSAQLSDRQAKPGSPRGLEIQVDEQLSHQTQIVRMKRFLSLPVAGLAVFGEKNIEKQGWPTW